MEGDNGSDRLVANSSRYSGLSYDTLALEFWILSFCRGIVATDAGWKAPRTLEEWVLHLVGCDSLLLKFIFLGMCGVCFALLPLHPVWFQLAPLEKTLSEWLACLYPTSFYLSSSAHQC